MDNKKTLILSIVGVLVLVIVVVGVSYAMYSFTGTGTKENVITTGTISVSYAENNIINLNAAYPVSDVTGATATAARCVGNAATTKTDCETAHGIWTNNTLDFNVGATLSGTTRIDYEIAIDPVAENTLGSQYVRFNLQRVGGNYIIGSATTGVTVASIAGSDGLLTASSIDGYRLTGASFTGTATHNYRLTAWVGEDYDLVTATSEGSCTGGTATGTEANEAACTAVGGTWTNIHSNSTTAQVYKFKIKVFATQVTGA